MNQPIHNGICDGWIANVVMPVLDGKLTRNKGRSCTMAFLDDFEKISPFGIVERRQCQIVKDEQMGVEGGGRGRQVAEETMTPGL